MDREGEMGVEEENIIEGEDNLNGGGENVNGDTTNVPDIENAPSMETSGGSTDDPISSRTRGATIRGLGEAAGGGTSTPNPPSATSKKGGDRQDRHGANNTLERRAEDALIMPPGGHHSREEDGDSESLQRELDGIRGRGSTGGARKSIVPIETFSGKTSEDISDFRDNFYRASVINGWSTQLTTLILPTFLGGRAREFFNNFPPETKASASRIFEALEDHFSSSAIRYQAKTLIHDRVQKPNESVADFYQNISAMVRKAWGGLSREGQRDKLLDYFIRGLRQPVKKIFFDREPSSVEEALREAESREIYLKSKQKALSVNQVDAERKNYRGGGDYERKIERNEEGGIELLRREIAEMRTQISKKDELIAMQNKQIQESRAQLAQDKNDRLATRQPGSPAAPRNVNFREAPSCWSCGSKSHFRAECPHKNPRDGGEGASR